MSRKRDTRYPHAFSKGRGVGFVSEGSWRSGVGPRAPCLIQTEALGAPRAGPPRDPKAQDPKVKPVERSSNPRAPRLDASGKGARTMMHYPITLDPRRWKVLRVSPTIANLYKGHAGVAVICADCLHGVGHRNPGLPDRFRNQWHLTLMELEKKCRCESCGSKNARVYPWWGNDDGGELGLDGPPTGAQ